MTSWEDGGEAAAACAPRPALDPLLLSGSSAERFGHTRGLLTQK